MQQRPESSAVPAQTAKGAAKAAASAEVLAARVAELEGQIASERAKNGARVKAVDGAMTILRKAVADLQEQGRRGAEERTKLQDQLEQSRRAVAQMSSGGAESRKDSQRLATIEQELGETRDSLEGATRELVVLRDRIAELQFDVGHRDETLADTQKRLDEAHAQVTKLEHELSETRAQLAEAVRVAQANARSAGAPSGPPSSDAPLQRSPLRSQPGPNQSQRGMTPPSRDGSANTSQRGAIVPRDDVMTSDPTGPGVPTDDDLIEDTNTGAGPVLPRKSAAPTAVPGHAAETEKRAHHAKKTEGEGHQDPSFPEIQGVRIERLVEEGPLGTTYEAREVTSRRPVIVRVLPGVLKLLDGKRLDSLLLAKHPNLVSVLSFAVCRAGPFLVMERADGEPANQWVRRIGPLPERIAIAVALECARALRQAAFHGALHTDLCPESILVDATGRVRIQGVGLRPILSPNDDTPRAPTYASPERLRGAAPDGRTDIYSLGAIIWFLLTGKAPFDGDRQAVARSQAVGAPDIREARQDISQNTAKLLQRMMAMDADHRHATWDQVLVELERKVPGQVSPELRGNLQARVRRFAVQHPWLVPAAISGLLGLAILGRIVFSEDQSAVARFQIAKVKAAALVARGDSEAAREILRGYLSGVGDPAVEREAAKMFDELEPVPDPLKPR